MNYTEFKEEIKDRVEGELNDGSSVTLGTVLKNNTMILDSLNISRDDIKCSPNFYLNDYYKRYEQGDTIEEMVDHMINTYNSSVRDQRYCEQDLEFDNVKDKITYRIISIEKNMLLLENTPYIEFLDLAIVFYVIVQADNENIASIRVNNGLLEKWEITVDDLYTIARINTPRLMEPAIVPMSSIIGEYMPDICRDTGTDHGKTDDMYVVTNRFRINGACAILCREVQNAILDILGHDFYILPSSIHEVIVMRTDIITDEQYISEMIRSINRECLSQDDILSDNLYIYRSDTRMIDII